MDAPQENSGKYIIGLMIIGVLILIIFVFPGKKNAPSEESGTEQNAPEDIVSIIPLQETDITEISVEPVSSIQTEVIINYDTDGFSPNTVAIKKGDTVIFENKTEKSASIVSDPHPTHTIYPEFDQYKTDQRGQDEFRFSFEKVGTWNYHDHLNSNMTGTVIVE